MPCCWCSIQFLRTKRGLEMLVHQRSLGLFTVMPYDLFLLTHIHRFVSTKVEMETGPMRWWIGSLHAREGWSTVQGERLRGMHIPVEVLTDRQFCTMLLTAPKQFTQEADWLKTLQQDGEVRV